MRISLDWISDYVDLPAGASPAQLAHELTLKTVEVEDVVPVDGDVVFDIDNKSLTHRPDLWGHYGIAREFAAIYRLPLRPLASLPRPAPATGLVGALDPALCNRFVAMPFTVDGATPTPAWIAGRLRRVGEASVNLCVDLSNYVMFTTGQPSHVYDADRVRFPLSAGLTDAPVPLDLRAGQDVDVAAPVPVIRAAGTVLGVAGVLGGRSSAGRPTSRHFVLAVATFRPVPIRRASQRLGLRTEASARYEKGLDTQRVDAAVDLFRQLLRAAAPRSAVTAMQDVTLEPTTSVRITVGRDFLDRRIGQRLDRDEIEGTLRSLGFVVDSAGDSLEITVPSWRATGDVSLPQDIVEEVARIHGYDRLATAPIPVTLTPVRALDRRPLDRVVREELAARAGLREVLTYPWSTDDLLGAAGYPKDRTVRFAGAPAPDRDSLRPALLPNLLGTVAENLRYRPSFGVFEVGTVFSGARPVPYHGVYEEMPPMTTMLGLALVGGEPVELFRRAKGILEMLRRTAQLTGLSLDDDPAGRIVEDAGWADRSARLTVRVDGTPVGTLALLTPGSRRLAGIGAVQVAGMQLDVGALRARPTRESRFQVLPELPETDFDLSVVVDDTVAWAQLAATVRRADELVSAVSYLDEYRGSWVPDGHRSLSLRVTLRPRDSTLTAGVIGTVRGAVLGVLDRQLNAHLRQN